MPHHCILYLNLPHPRQISIAARAYSSMCRNLTWGSCGGINRLGFGQHLVTEKPAEAQRRVEVHLASAEQRGQFEFHPRQTKQARYMPRLEFHQHVEITVGPGVAMQRRAKHGQLADMMPLAKLRDLRRRQLEV